jgi:hypothetical protein
MDCVLMQNSAEIHAGLSPSVRGQAPSLNPKRAMKKQDEYKTALELLDENIDRYERLVDPTSYEISMYHSIWKVRCRLQEDLTIMQMADRDGELQVIENN